MSSDMERMLAAMHSRPDGSDGRESREFWAITDDYRVVKTIGWSCAPGNPDYWWCPDLSFSMKFGHRLFNAEDEAKAWARQELIGKLEALK